MPSTEVMETVSKRLENAVEFIGAAGLTVEFTRGRA